MSNDELLDDELFINLFYDINYENESSVVRSGLYNKSNCGGACDWMISSKMLSDTMISLPYDDSSKLYVFSFNTQRSYTKSPSYQYMMTNTKTPPISMGNINEMEDPFTEFIYCYDHDEECLE
jgi:hypothetical protein